MFKRKYFAATAVLTLSSLSYAGQIDVVNETKKEIQVKIQAEGDKTSFVQSISADPHSSFKIETPQINGKAAYFIKGHISPFTSNSKCKKLNVDKNYTVTFQSDSTGTTCIATEKEEKKESKGGVFN